MNCFLLLRAYQLIEDLEQPRQYKITSLTEVILSNANNTYFVNRRFAAHILNNLSGMALLKAIDAINEFLIERLDESLRRKNLRCLTKS
ncbi:hypothetical protein H6H01_28145 [Nostoc calcicola FACHB-3891]|nr:hypothetical protein [Nostoc calcicola FACHB-3891]